MEKKKLLHIITVTILLLPIALSVIALTCSPEERAFLIVLGFYYNGGFTDYRVSLGGQFDLSDWYNPISGGAEIPDVTITSTNETAMISTHYTYMPPSAGYMGYFQGFLSSYVAGNFLSAEIDANNHLLHGADTQIPDSSATIISTGGTQMQPYILRLSITPGLYPATHIMIWVDNFSLGVNSWHVVPATQLSYTLDGFPSGSNYSVSVYPVNKMDVTNQASSYEAEVSVGSTAIPASLTLNF